VLGDVRGKYILEVGSGDGGNAILLALKGARVVGVDISPQAVEVAKRRASLHGVAERTAFFASPLELFRPPNEERFDVTCGWAVLHHLIPVLDRMLSAMAQIAKPNAVWLFSEPVVVWPWLRKLRHQRHLQSNLPVQDGYCRSRNR
jgi:2-polyprenyl-3-methyl-5-hydroxy-6-metoxy-1,4-benzoquinol methylase